MNYLKILIKLQAFDCKQLAITCNRIIMLLKRNNVIVTGAVSLPTKKRIYCILRSPHINKDAREHFEIRQFTKIIKLYTLTYINLKFFIPSGIKVQILTCSNNIS